MGGFASFATTFFTQRNHGHRDCCHEMWRSAKSCIHSSSKKRRTCSFDSLDKNLENPVLLIGLYSLIGRMRLIAGDAVLLAAEKVAEALSFPIVVARQDLRTYTS